MIVSQILKAKGNDVFTVSKDVKISEVSEILASKRIGAIVVTDQNQVVEGIISERDIVRGLAKFGANVLDSSRMPGNLVFRTSSPRWSNLSST